MTAYLNLKLPSSPDFYTGLNPRNADTPSHLTFAARDVPTLIEGLEELRGEVADALARYRRVEDK